MIDFGTVMLISLIAAGAIGSTVVGHQLENVHFTMLGIELVLLVFVLAFGTVQDYLKMLVPIAGMIFIAGIYTWYLYEKKRGTYEIN